MQRVQQLRQHAQNVPAIAALARDVPDLGVDGTDIASRRRCTKRSDFDPLHHRDPQVVAATRLTGLKERFDGLLPLAEPALPDQALIALSEDNRVLAANDLAPKLLDMADRSHSVGEERSEVIGDDLGEPFDYRHGAVTGASREGRSGKIIESSGGTLFLDEIGDVPLNMQSRLRRWILTAGTFPVQPRR